MAVEGLPVQMAARMCGVHMLVWSFTGHVHHTWRVWGGGQGGYSLVCPARVCKICHHSGQGRCVEGEAGRVLRPAKTEGRPACLTARAC